MGVSNFLRPAVAARCTLPVPDGELYPPGGGTSAGTASQPPDVSLPPDAPKDSGGGVGPLVGNPENRAGSPVNGPASNVTGEVAPDALMVAPVDSVGTIHPPGGAGGGSGSAAGLAK